MSNNQIEHMTQEQLNAIQRQVNATTRELRDIERLRAFANVDDAMVERAIRKQWGSRYWDEMLASDNDYDIALVQTYRDEMRDIIDAALAPQEGA